MHPHENLWDLSTAFVASRALHVVAELGVADHLPDGAGPTSAKELAAGCGAAPDALDRILRLLAAHGVFAADGDGIVHTDASRLLRGDHPMSMRAFARMMGMPGIVGTFDHLAHSVRTGEPAAGLLDPGGLWAYLEAHPDEALVFGEAMTGKAAADIGAVLGAYDFGRFATVADIGGGRGHLLRAVLDATPGTRGVLFDLPPVIDTLDVGTDRLLAQAGDFFVDPLPEADAYLLMEVIHDWADAEAAAILRAVRRAARPGARVVVIENVLADDASRVPDARGRTLDTIMLAVTGGRERTAAQLGALLDGAGFTATAVLTTRGSLRLVEAVAA